MVTRFVNLVVNINISEEELKKRHLNKEENYDDIWYKCVGVVVSERDSKTQRVSLKLESVEGEDLEKILSLERKQSKVPLLNVSAYIYNLNQEYKDLIALIPLQNGEMFSRYLTNDLDIYEDDFTYVEETTDKIAYSEEWREWEFHDYKWVAIIREEQSGGYSQRTYALKDLNNLSLCK